MTDSETTDAQWTVLKFTPASDDSAVGYLKVSPQPDKPGMVKRTVALADLIEYRGPAVYLDFDVGGALLGIEIVGDAPEPTD